MVKGICGLASPLFRLGRWAHNSESGSVLSNAMAIESVQGVRQGHPLGPLFFSLSIRSVFDDLSTLLVPEHVFFPYLDDIYIQTTLDRVSSFFDENLPFIRLNKVKSKITSLEEVRRVGMKCSERVWDRKSREKDYR